MSTWIMDMTVMRYVHHDHTHPGPAALSLRTTTVPEPQADDVRIRIHFAGINRPDLLQRDGIYPAPADASPHLGLEVSGVIDALGTNAAEQYHIGQTVCALTSGGGYADYVVVPSACCLPLPDDSWLPIGAALPEALFTLWLNFYQYPALHPGRAILIHGGASGLGSIAIQLAHIHNMRVYTSVSNAAKADYCKTLDAHPILYKEESFVERIRHQDPDKGVLTVMDIVGASYLTDHLRILSPGGQLICLGFMGTSQGTVNMSPLLTKQLTIRGSTLRRQSATQKAIIAQGVRKDIWPLVIQGTIVPHIEQIYPLPAYEAAHQHLCQPTRIGKILLDCRD